jgi:hypothetical protein
MNGMGDAAIRAGRGASLAILLLCSLFLCRIGLGNGFAQKFIRKRPLAQLIPAQAAIN